MRDSHKVTVLCEGTYVHIGDNPVAEVIAWLQETLALVPVEFRGSAEISISGGGEDDPSETEICYWRPETDEEMTARLDRRRLRLKQDADHYASVAEAAKRRLAEIG